MSVSVAAASRSMTLSMSAYNPYGAYNDAWSCPLPPRENWLTVPIRTGERGFRHA